ncbi:MAG TPA: hypothetical protein VJN64_10570 [Terriglobales bacterium]|nr:hypothetical protein [Terriglobales bacterium]
MTHNSATNNPATQAPAAQNLPTTNPVAQNPDAQDGAAKNQATQAMPQQSPARQWTKEEIVAAIKECAAKLKRVPTQAELKKETGITEKIYQRFFGNYTKALRACAYEGTGSGFTLSARELFEEWAGIVRKLGEVPSISEYVLHSKHSVTPLRKRFRYWSEMPAGMVQYATANGLEKQWQDVIEIAKKYRREPKTGGWVPKTPPSSLSSTPRVLKDRPLYGAPLMLSAMGFAPVNEMGVVFVFGLLAYSLGFIVTWMGTEFPDCEAFREVEPGRWQRVLIEFEFLSRNFLAHGHNPAECDLIVCWEHNWKECPLQVLELKKFFTFQQVRIDPPAVGTRGVQATMGLAQDGTQHSAVSIQHLAVSTQPGSPFNPFNAFPSAIGNGPARQQNARIGFAPGTQQAGIESSAEVFGVSENGTEAAYVSSGGASK